MLSFASTATLSSGTTRQAIYDFTLPAGVWVVHVLCRWDTNATGRRHHTVFRTNSQENEYGMLAQSIETAVNGGMTYTTSTFFAENTSGNNPCYIAGYQNSGNNLGCNIRAFAFRLS